MRRPLRVAAWVSVAILVCLAAGASLPRPFWPSAAGVQTATHRILVLTNPIHTDIAVPIDAAVLQRFAFLRDAGMPIDAPGARYLVFGWGGRDFYIATPTWSEMKLGPLLKGLTVDRSVMHVDVSGEIAESHDEVAGYAISDAAFDRLTGFIRDSFEEPAPQPIPNAFYGKFDAFYPANGYFTAILGCNTWTAAALRAAGLRTGWWNPLPVSLDWSLALHNHSAAD